MKTVAEYVILKIVISAGIAVSNLPAQTVGFVRRDTVAPLAPSYVFVADFNGDGKADLAVNNVVLLGNGDGTFRAPLMFAVIPADQPPQAGTGGRAYAFGVQIVADFNGDGKPDLMLTDGSILLGNGDGTFQPLGRVATAGYTTVAGDFNGDGKVDLVTAIEDQSSGSISLSILLGNGDGTFGAQVIVPVLSNLQGRLSMLPLQVVTADFNHDGKVDAAVLYGTTLSVMLGRGDGTFGLPITTSGFNFNWITVGDLDGDGIPDLVQAEAFLGYIIVSLGKGDGTFKSSQIFLAGNSAGSVVLGDFDGDGKTDVAVGQWINIATDDPSDFVSLLLGRGDGTFQPEIRFTVGNLPGDIAAGDFNGDGRIDLAAANWASNTVSVLINNGADAPQITVASSANGTATLEPDMIASAYGSGFSAQTLVASSLVPLLSLAGFSAQVQDSAGIARPAPLYYISSGQINFLIPAATAPGLATLVVTSDAGASLTAGIPVHAPAPGLFTAGIPGDVNSPFGGDEDRLAVATAVRVSADGGQTPVPVMSCLGSACVAVPIQLTTDTNVYLSLYGTGIRHGDKISCTVHGISVPVQYSGAQGTTEGLDQVNVLLTPELSGSGYTQVILTVDGQPSNIVSVAIQ